MKKYLFDTFACVILIAALCDGCASSLPLTSLANQFDNYALERPLTIMSASSIFAWSIGCKNINNIDLGKITISREKMRGSPDIGDKIKIYFNKDFYEPFPEGYLGSAKKKDFIVSRLHNYIDSARVIK